MTIYSLFYLFFTIYLKDIKAKTDMGILIDGLIHGETSATVVTKKYFKESAYTGAYSFTFTGESYNMALNHRQAMQGGVGVSLNTVIDNNDQVLRFCDVNEFCPQISLKYLVVNPTITITGATGVGNVYGSGYRWYYLKLESDPKYYPLKLEVNFSNLPVSGVPYYPVQQYNGNGILFAGLYFFSGMTGMQTPSTSYAVAYRDITGTDNSNGYGRVMTVSEIDNIYFSIYHNSALFGSADMDVIIGGESGTSVTYGGSASTTTDLSAMRFYYTSAGTHSLGGGQNEWLISLIFDASWNAYNILPTDENYKGKVVKYRNTVCRNGSKTADLHPISVDAYLCPAFWAEVTSQLSVKIKFYLQRQPGTTGSIGVTVRTYTGTTTSDLSLTHTYNVGISVADYTQQELTVFEGGFSPSMFRVTFATQSPASGTIGWSTGTWTHSPAWSPQTQYVSTTETGVEKVFTSVGGLSFGAWGSDFNANLGANGAE